MMKLVYLGPPGVGKGTHADLSAERFGIPKIAMGDIIRGEISKGTEFGARLKRDHDRGILVPDGIVMDLLSERIHQGDCKEGFILDGVPRTLTQAEVLSALLMKEDSTIDLVVYFRASENTLKERLGGRVTCRGCGQIYHQRNQPPQREGVCDVCGGELYVRPDQSEEAIEERLREYKIKTAPVRDFYGKEGILRDIDAEGSIPHIQSELMTLFETERLS